MSHAPAFVSFGGCRSGRLLSPDALQITQRPKTRRECRISDENSTTASAPIVGRDFWAIYGAIAVNYHQDERALASANNAVQYTFAASKNLL